jgi:hypothetical protein
VGFIEIIAISRSLGRGHNWFFDVSNGIEADSAVGCSDEQGGVWEAPISQVRMFA